MWFLLILCLSLVPGAWANEPAETQAKKPVAGQPEQTEKTEKKVLATVGDEAIYEEDLLPLIQSPMRQLRQQEYQIKSQVLEEVINQKLLEAEAQKKGIPAAQLLEQEVDSKVADPTDGEVEAFYMAQKDRINRPLEEIKAQLRQALHQSKLQQVREGFFQSLRAKVEVAVYLSPPRVEVDPDPERLRGDPNAPITIVEFSDYQCPFCERAYPVIKDLLAKYDGQVKLSYRDFPLREIHSQAQAAAEASRCAGEQGKFWEYHDLLFENFNKLENATLAGHARTLGLDSQQFEGCLSSGKHRAEIERDFQEGTQAGVAGTPGFFINGIFISGAQPAAAFEKVIEAELDRLQPKPAAQR
ncbi:MAG: thioredoxin domain-containing protein [Acidobacteria bacterium]|nr:thioredoxin domain-containing protein [Acidobacteriota bacterium]